jgi:amino acid transporter
MFPRAGGLYHFLREAYGPLPGFLYGWTAFTVIMSGGIAALAAGFAQYLAVLVPSLGSAVERWVAAAAIVGLTAINHRGVAPGAALQRLLTTVEVATIASFIVFGLVIVPAPLLPAPASIVEQADTAASPPLFAGAAAAIVAVRAASIVHPRFRTPTFGLGGQSTWAVLLALTGTYRPLYTFVVFAGVLFHAATGTAVFVLRARQPDTPRPYRAWRYPLTPILFVGSCALLLAITAVERPVESLFGLGLVALGLPAYAFWRRR